MSHDLRSVVAHLEDVIRVGRRTGTGGERGVRRGNPNVTVRRASGPLRPDVLYVISECGGLEGVGGREKGVYQMKGYQTELGREGGGREKKSKSSSNNDDRFPQPHSPETLLSHIRHPTGSLLNQIA